ncbi:hypothetical protein [Ezakiella peruensis]|uniref:hypothetical protein n=1 Tax=Ezakiella peruensis TaxID=1464038 RepID=UPI000C1B15EF|nr:hypothetical protein [Ezakiella peruensis]
MKEKLTAKKVEEIVLARYRAEEPRKYATEEERITAEKAMDERWKEIEEYGRKMYGKDYIEKKHNK